MLQAEVSFHQFFLKRGKILLEKLKADYAYFSPDAHVEFINEINTIIEDITIGIDTLILEQSYKKPEYLKDYEYVGFITKNEYKLILCDMQKMKLAFIHFTGSDFYEYMKNINLTYENQDYK